MTKKEKKAKMDKVVEILKKQYPEALCSLEYEGDGWKLLVMGRLSAQCTDERVNIVCRELFKAYPNAKALADAPLSDIEEIIKPCGLYKMKAKSIKEESRKLHYEYNGVVPDTIEELLAFEGVGRKIANLLLGDLYKKPAIVADTHCMRICGRLGMYKEGMKDPFKTEMIMKELIVPEEQSDFCHRMVLFGREFCTAKSPKCDTCPLKTLCKDEIKIQKLGIKRLDECLDLVWQVFSQFEVPVFPPEGGAEYKRIIEETREKKNISFYGAIANGKVVGVLGMRENNHIGYFYVDSRYHKRGIGKALFNRMKEDYDLKEFTVNAAPYGVPVYTRLGFVPTDSQKNVNGVIFTPMKYK
ncbi:MAG: GNAT family N-acetyltransferase [Clostridia bacterium]|nr:GNAT family N-acetyltransferase [Clostridia bacterium]